MRSPSMYNDTAASTWLGMYPIIRADEIYSCTLVSACSRLTRFNPAIVVLQQVSVLCEKLLGLSETS